MNSKVIITISIVVGILGIILTSCLVLGRFPHIKIPGPNGNIEIEDQDVTIPPNETEIEWSTDLL